jgi:hypothetical protein
MPPIIVKPRNLMPTATSPTIRPPTPVNPTTQTRPVSAPAPTTARPASSAATPDFSKAKPLAPLINSSLKDGIKALYNKGATVPAAVAAPVAVVPPVAAVEPPAVVTPPVAAVEPPVTAPVAAEPPDRFADIAEPEGISESGKKGWKALKTKAETEITTAQKKLADAESQLATLRKATPADVADVEKLKGEHQKALDRLAILDLQNHPDFTRQYTEPKAKALVEVGEILTYNGKGNVDPGLLNKPQKDFNAAVAEMTKDMNSMDASTVQTSMRTAYKLANDERTALAKAGELRSGIEAKDAQQRTQAFEKVYTGMNFENMVQAKNVPADATAEQKSEIAEYNQAISQTRATAERNAFGKLSVEDQASVSIKAALYDMRVKHVDPLIDRGYSAVVAERNALAKELQAIRGLKQPGSFTAPAEADTGEKKDAKYYLKKAFAKG